MLKLAVWPDPILKKETEIVEVFDEQLKRLSEDMFKVMKENRGIGLAAPQVGVNKRILVMNVDEPIVMVNPDIFWWSVHEKEKSEEGCLSFPGFLVEVERCKKIQVEYYDVYGNRVEKDMEGLAARCVQHEIDHLDGITFLQYVSKLYRDMITAKMKKLQKRSR